MGSKAATVRGVVRFVQSNRAAVGRAVRSSLWASPALRASEWKAAESRRLANPDAKRARADKAFRRRLLAGLRRREVRALAVGSGIAGMLELIDGGAARRAELDEVSRLRALATGKPGEAVKLPWAVDLGAERIPLGDWRAVVKAAGVSGVIMRGKDATIGPCFGASHGTHEAAYTDWSKGVSKPRGVRAVHDNFVRSFGVVVEGGRVLEFVVHRTIGRVELPEGYLWGRDHNGLRVYRVASAADDYHPSAADLLGWGSGAPGRLVALIEANRGKREAARAAMVVEAARVAGVYVCLADSLRAGNCREGTLSFGRRHGLDPLRHYSAPDLLAMANGDASRVRLAVSAARLRHERELAAGVCVLAEHRAD